MCCLWLYVKSTHACTIGFTHSLPDLDTVLVSYNFLCGCECDRSPFVADVSNINKTAPPMTVNVANGKEITSTATTEINTPHLPQQACKGHIMPQFTNNLIGIGNICSKGCTVMFTATEVIVRDRNGIQIWQGLRETNGARMWRLTYDHRQHTL